MRGFLPSGAFAAAARHRVLMARTAYRSPGYKALPGLRVAANTFKASLDELDAGNRPFRSIDAHRLCAAALEAGRLIGYLEALEATDRRLAQTVASDLTDVLASLEVLRQRFERRSAAR
jgi:hypothetical protein